jgi:hypothetical protein
LNRASATQTLTGVSIDGDAATVGTLSVQAYGTDARNSTANTILRTDANGNVFVKAINTSAHDKIAASPTYILASNNTGSNANVTTYQTGSLSVLYAATAGAAPASDVYAWAKATTKPSYTKSEVGLGNVDNTADSSKSVLSALYAGDADSSNTCVNKVQANATDWDADFTNTPYGSVKITGHVYGGAAGAPTNGAPFTGYWFQENYRRNSTTVVSGTQVAWGFEGNKNRLKTRNIASGVFGSWIDYLNSDNYDTYALPLAGGTLTGALNTEGVTAKGLIIGRTGTLTDINASSESGSISIRGNTTTTASMTFNRVGSYAMNMGLANNNTFVIGGYSASANCFVMTGTGALTMLNNVTAFSDERVKTNWRELPENFVEKLAEVKHGIYDRTDQESTQVGVSAQSLRTLLEHAVMEDDGGQLSVAYGNAALVSCIKLAQRLLESEQQIKELKSEMEILKGQIK